MLGPLTTFFRGTSSGRLAVTIRVLVDENLTTAKKLQLLWKEMRVGLVNGALLAVMALGFLGCYIHFFKAYAWGEAFLLSGCVGVALIIAMVVSSLVGTVIPMLFHKIHIDHQEKYSDEEIREILQDEECRKLYQTMVEVDSALEKTSPIINIDEEWEKFSQEHWAISMLQSVPNALNSTRMCQP